MSIRRRPAYLDWVFEYKIGKDYWIDFSIPDKDWHKMSQPDFVALLDKNIQSIIDLVRGQYDN